MHSWARRAIEKTEARALVLPVAALLFFGACSRQAPLGPVGSTTSPEKPVTVEPEFLFDSLDDRPVSSSALRGKPTVLAFIGSDDLASQAEADFLAAMAKHDGEKVNYALVAVEAPDRRELVQGFRAFFESKFGVSLRTGMADKDLLLGTGPFGDVRRLTVILLDPRGRVVWQKTGIAKAEEIRSAMARSMGGMDGR
jgi:hypothetical protein